MTIRVVLCTQSFFPYKKLDSIVNDFLVLLSAKRNGTEKIQTYGL